MSGACFHSVFWNLTPLKATFLPGLQLFNSFSAIRERNLYLRCSLLWAQCKRMTPLKITIGSHLHPLVVSHNSPVETALLLFTFIFNAPIIFKSTFFPALWSTQMDLINKPRLQAIGLLIKWSLL